ncbi:hypothetical protein AN8190.2 [Paecilomyces variotii No. 5]|uniref:Uncharacterized protein n=1 Tax=Byssochlamys spectabilis (strain No. 5 / NBRC 109023) TaxID=1356009 RepID=V5FAS3_BYSSN|nr:hypothetical protein AN8190.2 [Paecilomyces variotii No. 5]
MRLHQNSPSSHSARSNLTFEASAGRPSNLRHAFLQQQNSPDAVGGDYMAGSRRSPLLRDQWRAAKDPEDRERGRDRDTARDRGRDRHRDPKPHRRQWENRSERRTRSPPPSRRGALSDRDPPPRRRDPSPDTVAHRRPLASRDSPRILEKSDGHGRQRSKHPGDTHEGTTLPLLLPQSVKELGVLRLVPIAIIIIIITTTTITTPTTIPVTLLGVGIAEIEAVNQEAGDICQTEADHLGNHLFVIKKGDTDHLFPDVTLTRRITHARDGPGLPLSETAGSTAPPDHHAARTEGTRARGAAIARLHASHSVLRAHASLRLLAVDPTVIES